jgi:hypothetical protein
MYLKTTSKRSITTTVTSDGPDPDFPEVLEECLALVQSITTEKKRPSRAKAVLFRETELEETMYCLSRDDYTSEEKQACFISPRERKEAYREAQAASRLAVKNSIASFSEHPLHSVYNQAAKMAWASSRTRKSFDDVVGATLQNEDVLCCVKSLTKFLSPQNEPNEFRGLENFIRNLAEFHPHGKLDARNREALQSRQRIVQVSKEGLSSATIAALCKRVTCADVAVARMFALSDAFAAAG